MINLLIGTILFTVIIVLWFIIYYLQNPEIDNPDGKARITGKCGDTMEISLKFNEDKLVNATQWTNGCSYSLSCVWAAVNLSMGKNPMEILDIDANFIQSSIGGLSKDHMHCATLAAATLHAAIDNYMNSGKKETYALR